MTQVKLVPEGLKDRVLSLKSFLKSEDIDIADKEACLEALSQCVAPKFVTMVYLNYIAA